MGSEVVYTRTDDRFLSLRQRTKKANRNKADLFVSIHANSSRIRGISGVETYYLSLTSNSWALAVASRENAAAERSIHELRDLLSKIALTEKSRSRVSLRPTCRVLFTKGWRARRRGFGTAGSARRRSWFCSGSKCPPILAEVGFLSNPRDEKLLKPARTGRKSPSTSTKASPATPRASVTLPWRKKRRRDQHATTEDPLESHSAACINKKPALSPTRELRVGA